MSQRSSSRERRLLTCISVFICAFGFRYHQMVASSILWRVTVSFSASPYLSGRLTSFARLISLGHRTVLLSQVEPQVEQESHFETLHVKETWLWPLKHTSRLHGQTDKHYSSLSLARDTGRHRRIVSAHSSVLLLNIEGNRSRVESILGGSSFRIHRSPRFNSQIELLVEDSSAGHHIRQPRREGSFQ